MMPFFFQCHQLLYLNKVEFNIHTANSYTIEKKFNENHKKDLQLKSTAIPHAAIPYLSREWGAAIDFPRAQPALGTALYTLLCLGNY